NSHRIKNNSIREILGVCHCSKSSFHYILGVWFLDVLETSFMNTECHFISGGFSTSESDTWNKDTPIFHFYKSVRFVQFGKNSSICKSDTHAVKNQILRFGKLNDYIFVAIISGN